MSQYANTAIAHYAAWPYRALYTIADPPTEDGITVRLTVGWGAGIAGDFSNLRFRDPATLKRCAYRVESYVAGTSAVVEVLLYGGQDELELLYGNVGAPAESNGADVYAAFADFSAGGIPPGWESVVGNDPRVTIAGGVLTVTGAAGETHGIRTTASFGINHRVLAKLSWSAVGATMPCWVGFRAADGIKYAVWGFGYSTVGTTKTFDEGPDEELQVYAANHPTTSKEYGVKRRKYSTLFEYDGSVVAEHAEQMPTVAMPAFVGMSLGTGSVSVDWILVRKLPATEPTLTLAATGANPYAATAPETVATAPVGVAFALGDVTTTHTGPMGALWSEQLPASWTCSHGVQDAFARFSGRLDRHIDPAIRNFPRVDVTLPDHRDPALLNRIWHGYILPQETVHAAAANTTDVVGYEYAAFIPGRTLPRSLSILSKGTDPGAWLKDYFDSVGDWPDATYPTLPMFDCAKIRTGVVTAPADIVCSGVATAWQMCQKIADRCGWIFLVKPREVGVTPSYSHDDPTYRVIRIEAEDYDPVSGTGYYDTTPANEGGAYRPDEGVDIEYFSREQGYNVGWIRNGEWLRYTVAIPKDRAGADITGTWTATFRTAAPLAGRWFDVYWSTNPNSYGAAVKRVYVKATGAYDSFIWNVDPNDASDHVDLPVAASGTHYLKLVFGGAGTASNAHMNLAAIDIAPPPVVGDETVIRPAIYFVDEDEIDSPTVGLDLPRGHDGRAVAITRPDATLVSPKYQRNVAEWVNSCVVRFKWKNSSTGAMDDAVHEVAAWAGIGTHSDHAQYLEGWIDHVEVLDEPIAAASLVAATAIAQALCDDLLDFYSADWGTVTATFTKRTDLQYLQAIRFVGYDGIPETDDLGNDYEFRITNISYTWRPADVTCSITAMPLAKWSLLRRINRILNPDQVSETEATIKAVLATLPPNLTGTVTAVDAAGGFCTVAIDGGGTLTCRAGAATLNDRVLCVYSQGAGYVATVTQVVAD